MNDNFCYLFDLIQTAPAPSRFSKKGRAHYDSLTLTYFLYFLMTQGGIL